MPDEPIKLQVVSLVAGQRAQNLGKSTTLPPGSSFLTVLQTDVKEPSATELITVWLRAERASFDAPAIEPVPPIARVEFGAGGARAGLLELDVPFTGAVFAVPCSSLRIDARLRPGSIQLDSVSVSAFLARGTRPGGCGCPRRTVKVGPATDPVIDIPPGAVALTYFSLGLPAVIQWIDAAGAITSSYAQGFAAPPTLVPIPSDTRQVSFAGLSIGRAVFGAAA